ncbi:hypothetical protein [Actinophytocola gossypii]|uniref:Uncharacterized protein n=1 Tax=Actinophytocola gossypii TaxID=2812003 RepID=A0ABT2J3N2_9PSEU|nr:hypothetical protein [Actinophytocola gossypii]MCT2582361.1 hypothetical protein [Actinophytocola gossypii]
MGLHRRYLRALAQTAWQDGVVTEAERADLLAVAGLLGLTPDDVDSVLTDARSEQHPPKWGAFRLQPGDTVASPAR